MKRSPDRVCCQLVDSAVYLGVPTLDGGTGVDCAGGASLVCGAVDYGVVEGCPEVLATLDPVVLPGAPEVVLGGGVVVRGASGVDVRLGGGASGSRSVGLPTTAPRLVPSVPPESGAPRTHSTPVTASIPSTNTSSAPAA